MELTLLELRVIIARFFTLAKVPQSFLPSAIEKIFMNKVRIIFFGSFEFAVPVLEALILAEYNVTAVVTNPDKPSSRKKILTPPPIKIAAQKLGLNILQPRSLKNTEFLNLLKPITYNLKPDLGIVVGYGKIIPPEIFNLPKHGTLNIHPSLLPKYRGPSPVQTAMLNGDTKTGVTIMKLDEELDHGEIVATTNYQLPTTSSSEEAHTALFKLGAALLIKILPDYLADKIKSQPQDHSRATYTHKFTTEDGEIKQTDTAEQAYNKIRALNPEPGAYIWFTKGNERKRLKILGAELENGRLKLKKVQLEGGKPMVIKQFLVGHPKFSNILL